MSRAASRLTGSPGHGAGVIVPSLRGGAVAGRVAIPVLLLAASITASGEQILPPGYGELGYTAPAPGTYELPVLDDAADGVVLSSDGMETRLHEVFGGANVLLSFVYSTCRDTAGCPLATAVFHRIKQRLQQAPEIAGRLRLVTLSFDPAHDTPEVMRLYGEGLKGPGVDWRFLTTASADQLAPILAAYNQSVIKEYDEHGDPTGGFAHVLRVYLIDREKRIRNIYSVSFLHPDLLVNDVKTVLLEQEKRQGAEAPAGRDHAQGSASALSGPGDFKAGYGDEEYVTRSRSLEARKGEPADLVRLVEAPPLGLPPVPVPAGNPITRAKVELGRKLFFDRRLSLNNTFSCAMCHIPEQGFTSNEMATAVGFEGRTVRRNAPTIYNSGYLTRLFHDGREYSLESQIWGPLLAANEMANPSVGSVINKLRQLPDYQGLFETAFDGRGPGMETLGMALASYQRTLLAGDSAFDRWYYAGEETALSASEKRGFALFTGKAGCVSCHSVGDEYSLFTDNGMHNTGIGYRASMQREPESRAVTVAPGVVLEVPRSVIDSVSERPHNDLGLYEVTQNPADRWKYRTPTLRNLTQTAPYMHDGSLGTLREVVAFYNRGGVPNEGLDPRVRPLGLSENEEQDLVSFLASLTGSNVDLLVSDAFAAPIGDPASAGMSDR